MHLQVGFSALEAAIPTCCHRLKEDQFPAGKMSQELLGFTAVHLKHRTIPWKEHNETSIHQRVRRARQRVKRQKRRKTEQEETKTSPAGFVPTSQLNGGRKIEREK